MKEALIHTPNGVRDIYNGEYKKKSKLEDALCHVLELYNYQGIQTPTFEFFDIFNQEKGSARSKEMYKFFDRENNTLVLRPDMTPSIARCVAKYYEHEDAHIRLYYKGNTFKNNSNLQGKLQEVTNVGAELIGDDTSAADGEIISMVIDCFLAAGIKEFQVSIGQVDYFKGLVEEAGLDKDTEDLLREAIENKNAFAIEEIMESNRLSDNLRQAFIHLTDLYGNIDKIKEAKERVKNERSKKAIERLEKLYTIMTYYGYEKYVSFDLGMLSRYDYYTGVIFKGYTYGTGDAVVKGGRYNNLIKQFGKDAPSVGFAFIVDELMNAMNRQKIEIDYKEQIHMILYPSDYQSKAILLAKHMRQQDNHVQLTRKSSRKDLNEYLSYAKEHGIDFILYTKDENEIVEYNLNDNTDKTFSYEEYMGGAK